MSGHSNAPTTRVVTVPKMKRTEGVLIGGVYFPPNACKRCGKWLAPWKSAVPAASADQYCWGDCEPDPIRLHDCGRFHRPSEPCRDGDAS